MTTKEALRILEKTELPKVTRATDPCATAKQIKPILTAVAFLIGWIPGLSWAAKASAAILAAIKIIDQVCP